MGSAMPLHDALRERRRAILDRWKELALSVYPERAASFLSNEPDRFQNPVGHALDEGLAALFDGAVGEGRPEGIRRALDGVVRIRAVQDLPPSAGVGFVFLLKQAIRDVLGAAPPEAEELAEIHDRIDRFALEAFDQFLVCREKIYELRVREVRARWTAFERLMERGSERPDGAPDGRWQTKPEEDR
jgi:hypothetical protein